MVMAMGGRHTESQMRVRARSGDLVVQLRVRVRVQPLAWVLIARVKARRTTRTRTDTRSSMVSPPQHFLRLLSLTFCAPTTTAIVARQFLDATKSQLTYHGLFQLASTLEPDSLVALFRNAHLSVVYKSPRTSSVTPQPNAPSHIPSANAVAANTNANPTHHAQEPALYALVTDDVFLHEPSIVWERLEDVDGYLSSFCDSDFHRAVPVGGDVAGQTAEGALRRFEMEAGLGVVDPLECVSFCFDMVRENEADESGRMIVSPSRDRFRPRKTSEQGRFTRDVIKPSSDDDAPRKRRSEEGRM